MKTLTQEQIDLLNKPLPPEALKQHPSKSFLTTINSIYVTERLNDVFGIGAWKLSTEPISENQKEKGNIFVVCKTTIEIPEYGIRYECFGGNDNSDYGDAYKGATTDAITKIGSWLGIGAHVWKNQGTPNGKPLPQQPAKPQKPLRERIIDYIKSMDYKKRTDYLTYFQITDLDNLSDDKAKEIEKYEIQKAKEKKQ
jgi:hypothetical protein